MEFLHPGIYARERRTGLAPIQGVSTSNMGMVGFTLKGSSNTALLHTSFTAFERQMGGFTSQSQVPTHVFAFFANGGLRAYTVRVTPNDADTATGYLTSDWKEETVASGDGVGVAFDSVVPTPGQDEVDIAHVPEIEPSSVSVTYYETGVPVVGEASNLEPVPSGAPGARSFAGKFASRPIPGTVTINSVIALKTYTDPGNDGILLDGGVAGETVGYIDYATGHFTLSVLTAAKPANPADVNYDYTPLSALRTIVDDGVGGWTGPTVVGGALDYTNGEWSITFTVAPADDIPIVVAYVQRLYQFDAISAGAWGNDVRASVRGNTNYFTRATASYSRYDVQTFEEDVDGVYQLAKTFEDLSFTDSLDARYMPNILNNVGVGSDLLDVVEPSNEDVGPRSLAGYSRTRAIGAGNGVAQEFGTVALLPTLAAGLLSPQLDTPVQPGSVNIAYTDNLGAIRAITDDGSGNLTGDVDGTAAAPLNTIDYTTGDFAVKTALPIIEVESSDVSPPTGYVGVAAMPIITHYLEPDNTITADDLIGGDDGTVLTRAEITSPALKTNRDGMYALLQTDELMNVTIPDSAGDVAMISDQITEAETNEKWFVVVAPPPGLTPQQVKAWRLNTLNQTSSYGALYWPYITISDPVTDLPTNIPPGGHIAGILAKTDANKSVGKAPAGVNDGKLSFATGLAYTAEFAELDILSITNQVNALVNTTQTGLVVWGARTLERPPSDFRFVHVRRTFNFLKASIFNSTHGFVFENVGPALWNRIKLSVESFLSLLFQQGIFKGVNPSEAFLVVCDETNNPKEVQDAGLVQCNIFVAMNVPGEFLMFTVQQKVTIES